MPKLFTLQKIRPPTEELQTYLSNESLGLESEMEEKKDKRKALFRKDRMKRYPVCFIPPVMGWVPKRYANFIMGFSYWTHRKYLRLIPEQFNPSLWLHAASGHAAVRVPRSCKKSALNFMKRRLVYNGAKNQWFQRRLRRRD